MPTSIQPMSNVSADAVDRRWPVLPGHPVPDGDAVHALRSDTARHPCCAVGPEHQPDSPAGPAAPATADAAGAPAGVAGDLRVVYIDDNPINTMLMAAMFERMPGLSLLCETDPQVGLALALAQPPALLLVDIQMPGLDGYGVLRQLRAHPATCNVPAIAVSANAMPQDLARGRAAGFADYLTKPLDVDRLRQALHAMLPGWQPPN